MLYYIVDHLAVFSPMNRGLFQNWMAVMCPQFEDAMSILICLQMGGRRMEKIF